MMEKYTLTQTLIRITVSICLICIVNSKLLSQTENVPIKVTGHLNGDNRTIHVSDEIKKILFLYKKAELYYPTLGHFLNLNEDSANKLGRKSIIVIPISHIADDYIWYNYDKDITLEVYPVPFVQAGVYYTEDNSLLSTDNRNRVAFWTNFWSNPQPSDTITNYRDYEPDNFMYTKLLIDLLDSDMEITLKNQILYETTSPESGVFEPEYTYSQIKVSDMAINKLFSLNNTGFNPPITTKSKSAWDKWLDNLPEPNFTKTNIKLNYKGRTPWSDMTRSTFKGESFLQRKDNKNIYALIPDSPDYIFDTEKDTLIENSDNMIFKKNIDWEKPSPLRNENINLWLNTLRNVSSSRFIQVPDNNSKYIVAYVVADGYNKSLNIVKIDINSYQTSKTLTPEVYIPIEKDFAYNGTNIRVMQLFEAHNKYYLIINFGNYNYWAVLTDDMFN